MVPDAYLPYAGADRDLLTDQKIPLVSPVMQSVTIARDHHGIRMAGSVYGPSAQPRLTSGIAHQDVASVLDLLYERVSGGL